jgi:hypothetical protein
MTQPCYRYGDFPELFWDAQRDAIIEPDNVVMLSRVLRSGSMKAIRQLVDFDIVRQKWDELWLTPDVRYVWAKVLDRLAMSH